MKRIYSIAICILSSTCAFSQGLIIGKESKSVHNDNVKIKAVKNDSVFYTIDEKAYATPISLVLVYSYNYEGGNFVFPDPDDQELYDIKDGELKVCSKARTLKRREARRAGDFLSSYKMATGMSEHNRADALVVLTSKDSLKTETFDPKNPIYLILHNDGKQTHYKGHIFKITNDSVVYFTCSINNNQAYYAIPKNDVIIVGLESQKTHSNRMLIGGISCLFVLLFPPIIFVPIHTFSSPNIKQYNLQGDWKMKLKA